LELFKRLGGCKGGAFTTVNVVEEDEILNGALKLQVGEGAVVGARSSVFKDIAPWTVVGGNPARKIRDRIKPV